MNAFQTITPENMPKTVEEVTALIPRLLMLWEAANKENV